MIYFCKLYVPRIGTNVHFIIIYFRVRKRMNLLCVTMHCSGGWARLRPTSGLSPAPTWAGPVSPAAPRARPSHSHWGCWKLYLPCKKIALCLEHLFITTEF